MLKKIWLSSPHIGESEFKFVKDAFDTNWIAPLGPHVDNFEKELSENVGVKGTAVLSSGTAAIHLALILLGAERDDEVICSSFTFSGSANPIVYQNAVPVFIDSERETWNMDPELLEEAIKRGIRLNRKPKAIILVHLYGMPAKMDEITAIANRYEIPIIEDAAEALGSWYKGQACGSFGKVGIISFNGNKIITTSGGGAFLSGDIELVKKARFLSTQARDNAPHYQHTQIGYNYRMSNVCAAIGRGQLKVLSERVKARRRNFLFYKNALSAIDGIEFLEEPDGFYSNHWLTTILIDPNKTEGISRETIRIALEKENIESRPLWKPMHLQPVFAKYPSITNGVSEELFEKGLCLPSGSNLTEIDLIRVVNAINKTFGIPAVEMEAETVEISAHNLK